MEEIFKFTISPAELFVRGTIVYLGLVVIMRFVLRRDVGSMSVADVLFIVLIADASQNAMAGEYTSVGDGSILIATLVGWNLALDWCSFRFVWFRRVIEPKPLPLISRGKWVRQNLKKEWITVEEIQSKLREQGIEDVTIVHSACLETSGELSVIRQDRKSAAKRRSRTKVG